MRHRLSKKERQALLVEQLQKDPFMTDEDIAQFFDVSVQTIRLDRAELGIPEVRERMKEIAEKQLESVRSLDVQEVIGEIVDLELDHSGISIFVVQDEHVFKKTKVARGHHIFAQANSLAIAIMNEEVALTAIARVKFIRPVYLNERLVAKAKVRRRRGSVFEVMVDTWVKDELVFNGVFFVHRAATFKEES